MKRHLPKNKSGAIQMSMQTIIVVVIGVTLLVLGLKFVYDTFLGVSQRGEEINRLTEKQIKDLFGQSDEPIYLPADTIDIKKGKTDDFDVNLMNLGPGDANVNLVLEVDGENIPEGMNSDVVRKWFIFKKNANEITEGEGANYKVAISKIPKSASLGVYLLTFKAECSEASDLCGSSADFILEVTT